MEEITHDEEYEYIYIGLDAKGQEISGEVSAKSKKEAERKIRLKSIYPTELHWTPIKANEETGQNTNKLEKNKKRPNSSITTINSYVEICTENYYKTLRSAMEEINKKALELYNDERYI